MASVKTSNETLHNILEGFVKDLERSKAKVEEKVGHINLHPQRKELLDRILERFAIDPYLHAGDAAILPKVYMLEKFTNTDNIALLHYLTGSLGFAGVSRAYLGYLTNTPIGLRVAALLDVLGKYDEKDRTELGVGKNGITKISTKKVFDAKREVVGTNVTRKAKVEFEQETELVFTDGQYTYVFESDPQTVLSVCENYIFGNRTEKQDVVFCYPQKNLVVYEYLA